MRTHLRATVAAVALSLIALPVVAAAQPKPVALFNAKDLTGWKHFLVDPAVPASAVWSIKDGVLTCKGAPLGYLYTEATYVNYKLVVEWQWAPGEAARLGKTPNSGIFLRINGAPKPKGVPRTYEMQLQQGNAGDVMGFWGMTLDGAAERRRETKGSELVGDMVGFRKLEAAEKPEGEWNTCEITVNGPSLAIFMNGKKVNEATGVAVMPGHIGLQSEGGEIRFRRVELTPLGK